jgi:hypothetical protein
MLLSGHERVKSCASLYHYAGSSVREAGVGAETVGEALGCVTRNMPGKAPAPFVRGRRSDRRGFVNVDQDVERTARAAAEFVTRKSDRGDVLSRWRGRCSDRVRLRDAEK